MNKRDWYKMDTGMAHWFPRKREFSVCGFGYRWKGCRRISKPALDGHLLCSHCIKAASKED